MENISPLLDDGMDGVVEAMGGGGGGIYYTGLYLLLCFRGISNDWLSVCIYPRFPNLLEIVQCNLKLNNGFYLNENEEKAYQFQVLSCFKQISLQRKMF